MRRRGARVEHDGELVADARIDDILQGVEGTDRTVDLSAGVVANDDAYRVVSLSEARSGAKSR